MATINSGSPTAQLRQPRGFVTINNIQIPWERFETNEVNYSSASTFRVMIPANSLPSGLSLADLTNNTPLTVSINAGIPSQTNANNVTPSDLPLLIKGNADEFSYEPNKTLITISGRDYAALFMDNKLNQVGNNIGFKIQSILSQSVSSDIITLLAQNRGLTPVVTPTQNPIGNYYQPGGSGSAAYTLNTSQITEWDLMVYLAKEENYNLFVKGNSLYFQPKNTSDSYQIILTIPYFMSQGSIPLSNAIDVQLTRNLKLANNIIVQVTSWNVNDKATYTKTASLIHLGTGQESGTGVNIPLVYNYRFPNLTVDQAQQKANQLLKQISQHEMTLNVSMPADTLLKAQDTIMVKQTNTLFDQAYYVKNITREMDFSGGFLMHIEANNTPSNAQIGTLSNVV